MGRFAVFSILVSELIVDIFRTFKTQSLSRGYLLALSVFIIAVIFAFLALSPALYSFVYPLF